MKRRFDNQLRVLLLSAIIAVTLIPISVFSENESSADEAKAARTIMFYCCGSDLETNVAMASFNIRQILSSSFSADNDVRFLIMTGGAKKWHLEDEKLSDPFHKEITIVDGKKTISSEYNQIWEAKGIDARDEENAGKLVLLDADGITSDSPVQNEDELMSDPKTLKAFINFCVDYAPAEKYDLILWDHGAGPDGGFAADQHNPDKETGHMMLLPEIIDAISDNAVTNNDADNDGTTDKFDFIDFDACVMSSVELIMTMADYTDYYIASPQTEPGYGQYYGPGDGKFKGWLNEIGDSEKSAAYNIEGGTFELGKVIVDDFLAFYQNGPGKGAQGTLTVMDMQRLVAPETGFVQALTDLNSILQSQATGKTTDDAYMFYDEFGSSAGSINYNGGAFCDLGNFVGQLAVTLKEVSKTQAPDENPYVLTAEKILNILDDDSMIYGGGTDTVRADARFYLDKKGKLQFEEQYTSGIYTFFPTTDGADETLQYCENLAAAIDEMPEPEADDRKALLNASIGTAARYSIIAETGIAVSDLLNPDEETVITRDDVDYARVREYWKDDGDAEPIDGVAPSTWNMKIAPLIAFAGGDTDEIEAWMNGLVLQHAREAISNDCIDVYSVKGRGKRNGTRVVFNDTGRRVIDSVNVNVIAELPYAEKYIDNDPFLNEYRYFIPAFSIGSVSGTESLDDLEVSADPEQMMENYMEWYNAGTSTWDVEPLQNKWYALRDRDGELHAASVTFTEEGTYVLISYEEEADKRAYAYLGFSGSKITDICFVAGNSLRPVKASELKTELKNARTEQSVVLVGILQEYVPMSGSTFDITPDHLNDIKLDFTDVENITDIRDTDGDGESLKIEYVAKDIYSNEFDFSAMAASPSGTLIDINHAVVRSTAYNGKIQKPVVTYNNKILKEGTDYTLYKLSDKNRFVNPGNYYVTLHGKGRFCGVGTAKFKITKAANTLKVKSRTATVKYKKLKKKAQILGVHKVIKFTKKGQGTKKYTLSSAKKGKKSFRKYFKVNAKSGKVTIKKKLRKGTYKVTVKVKAAGNANYKPSGWKKVTFRIKVK